MPRTKADHVVFAPDAGRRTTLQDGWTLALLTCATMVWVALLGSAFFMWTDVQEARAVRAADRAWILAAEKLRREVAAVEKGHPLPADLARRLAEQEPWRDNASLADRAATRRLVEADRAAASLPVGDPRRDVVARAAESFDKAVIEAIRAERFAMAQRTHAMDHLWTRVYAFGAASLVTLAGLILTLWCWRREKRLLGVRERRFRALVQSSQDLIWAVNAKGVWTFVNDAARRIYGYDPEAMIGRPFKEFLAPELVEKDTATFQRILAGESHKHYETEHIGKDGRRVKLLYTASVMRDAKGRVLGTMGTATDVTDLRAMQQQVLLHERLQAVATLGGGVAHDFNNLLTVIIGQAQVAKAKEDLSPQLDRRLNSILDTAERARKLTQQLIAFARRQPTKHEVIDLIAVIRQMSDLLRNLVGGAIRIKEELSETPVRIEADWGQIDQVVMNFVVNARDALPHGGTVTIAVREVDVSPEEAHRIGLAAGRWALLEVRDDGEGMDEETLEHVFEPFFTTKEPGKGTGLGLANVLGVVAQHGGRVVAASEKGEGTTMRVYLPLVATPTTRTSSPGPKASQTFPVSVA